MTPRPKRIAVGFAGGGGSSIAISLAGGGHPDAALNHWPAALAVHAGNFPETAHYCADIFETDCREVLPGEDIGLMWFSPDCRHFSKAKGGTPVSARVRGLAWSVIPWAKLRRPDVIMVENVDEFVTWSPLIDEALLAARNAFVGPLGKPSLCRKRDASLMRRIVAERPADHEPRFVPDPERKGETFDRFVRRLRQCGRAVEWVTGSSAAGFGALTIRRRFLLISRSDGWPVAWPAPTHAPPAKAKAARLKPYRAAAEFIDFARPCHSIFLSREAARAVGVKRPLEEATMRRISKGLVRETFAKADPFIVNVTHAGDDRLYSVREPLRTMTTAPRGEFALVAPVIAPHLTRQFGASVGSGADAPIGAITAGGGGKTGLVAAFLEQANTGMIARDARSPLSTIVGKGCTQRLVTAQLAQLRGSNRGRGDLGEPLPSPMAAGSHLGLLTAMLDVDQPMARPFSEHGDELRAFLIKYYGEADAADLADPLGTVTSRSRFGLVMVSGVAFRIVDIGMRMLDPETELAAAMGVPRGYVLGHDVTGRRVPKTQITKMVGNMVETHWAAAHLRANCAHLPWWGQRQEMAA